MTKDKASLHRRVRLLFEARGGEVTDKELCLNFTDEEVDYLFKANLISPTGPTWIWVTTAEVA